MIPPIHLYADELERVKLFHSACRKHALSAASKRHAKMNALNAKSSQENSLEVMYERVMHP